MPVFFVCAGLLGLLAVSLTVSVGREQSRTLTAEFSVPSTYLRRPSLGLRIHCVDPPPSSNTTL